MSLAGITTGGAQTSDIEVSNPPSDGVSSLSFSPNANLLAATSWGTCAVEKR